MSSKLTSLVAVIGALAVLAAGAGIASAATISFSPAGSISMESLGRTTFTGGAIRMECALRFRGALTRGAISTAAGTRFGELSGLEIASCAGGSITGILNLPWSWTMTRLTESGLSFVINNFSIQLTVIIFGIPVVCLYSGNLPALLSLIAGNTGLVATLTNSLAKFSGSAACPSTISLSSLFVFEPQQRYVLA